MLLVEYYQQTSTITSLQASTTMSRFHVFMFLLTDTQQWPFPITFLVLAIFLLLLSFLFSLEALGYLHLTSYYFLPIHSMLILVVFSFLLLFLPTSYVYLYIPGFFPHFRELSPQKPLIFGHCDVSVVHWKHSETRTFSASKTMFSFDYLQPRHLPLLWPYFNLKQKIRSLTQCSTWEAAGQEESKVIRRGGSVSLARSKPAGAAEASLNWWWDQGSAKGDLFVPCHCQ